jgi:type II secretory pathway pseudopilin PulG
MARRSHNFSMAPRGATLVEVIAGLVILGTILASLLIARGRFLRQDIRAQRQIQAIRALDHLAHQWMNGPAAAVPIASSGPLPGADNQTWRTRIVPDPSAAMLNARVLRIDVLDPAERQPIASLDLLLRSNRQTEANQ